MKKIFSLFLILVFVLTSCFSAFASGSDSSFVTESDGKSYGDLPSFPTSSLSRSDGYYLKYSDYLLLKSKSTGSYLLLASSVPNNYYIYGGYLRPAFERSGVELYQKLFYTDSSCTVVSLNKNYRPSSYVPFLLVGGVWVRDVSFNDSNILVSDYDFLSVSSTVTVYSDLVSGTVFIKSAGEPLVAGISSTEMKEMTLKQVVGLIPLVIGFLMLLLAFWKAWQFLLRLLKAV